MDRINSDFLDDVIKSEPMVPTPPDFTKQVMAQIQLERISGFHVFSLLDLILSLGAALTFGLVVSLPLLLPEQMRPWIVWAAQWAFYTVEKTIQTSFMGMVLLGVGGLVGLLLFALRKEVFLKRYFNNRFRRQEEL